jgi:hypothetical protein
MSARGFIGIAALAGMVVCGLTSALINIEMMAQVNAKLPEDRRFSPLGWYAPKTMRLFHEYMRLYPNGKLHLSFLGVIAIAFSCLICIACAIALP